jgi:hypothetical protein
MASIYKAIACGDNCSAVIKKELLIGVMVIFLFLVRLKNTFGTLGLAFHHPALNKLI